MFNGAISPQCCQNLLSRLRGLYKQLPKYPLCSDSEYTRALTKSCVMTTLFANFLPPPTFHIQSQLYPTLRPDSTPRPLFLAHSPSWRIPTIFPPETLPLVGCQPSTPSFDYSQAGPQSINLWPSWRNSLPTQEQPSASPHKTSRTSMRKDCLAPSPPSPPPSPS